MTASLALLLVGLILQIGAAAGLWLGAGRSPLPCLGAGIAGTLLIILRALYDADILLLTGQVLLLCAAIVVFASQGEQKLDLFRVLRRMLKASSLFLILVGVILFLKSVDPSVEFFSNLVDERIRNMGMPGIALYVGAVMLLVCAGVPRQLLSFAGGYAFGALWGLVWASLGVTLGCALSFHYARFLGQRLVQRHFGQRIQRLEKFLSRNPLVMAFIIRCLPVGNNLMTNVLAGVSRIPALPFIAGSCLGYIPQNLVFALLGSGINVDNSQRILISAALFLLAALLGLWLHRRYSRDVEEIRS